MIANISVVIIVKNGAKTIERTLNSVKNFTDVVIYDNGSTDKTLEIIKKYKNVNLICGEFLGFGQTKNKAATFAKNNWVLSIDSDEVLSKELINELVTIKIKTNNVYRLSRINFYKDKQIKYCWDGDKIIRLYNQKITTFTNKKVHEHIIANNIQIIDLYGILEHYSYNDITDFVQKLDIYSTAFAIDNCGKKSSSPFKAFFNGGFSFFKTYIFKRGFMDGYIGLVIAFSHMATNFYKYIKLYELNKESKKL